jgi:hypothetical protein
MKVATIAAAKLPAGARHGRMFRIAARSHAHRIGPATARIPRAQ